MTLINVDVPLSIAGRVVRAAEPCVQRDINLEAEWIAHMERSRILWQRFIEAGVPLDDAGLLLPLGYAHYVRNCIHEGT